MINLATLTASQQQEVTRITRQQSHADWTISPLPESNIQMLGIGVGFIWAVVIGPDGTTTDREAVLGPWMERIS